jgi:hypothetical protein
MKALATNANIVKSLELEELLSKLDLSKDQSYSRRPSYNELYLTEWARNTHTELRHREAVHKIVHWPALNNNKVGRIVTVLKHNLNTTRKYFFKRDGISTHLYKTR